MSVAGAIASIMTKNLQTKAREEQWQQGITHTKHHRSITASLTPYIDINKEHRNAAHEAEEKAIQQPTYKKADMLRSDYTIDAATILIFGLGSAIILWSGETRTWIIITLLAITVCAAVLCYYKAAQIRRWQNEFLHDILSSPKCQMIPLNQYVRDNTHIDIVLFKDPSDEQFFDWLTDGYLPINKTHMQCAWMIENDDNEYYGFTTIDPDAETIAFEA